MIFHYRFDFHFLDVGHVEHFFVYLLAIHMSYLEKYLDP